MTKHTCQARPPAFTTYKIYTSNLHVKHFNIPSIIELLFVNIGIYKNLHEEMYNHLNHLDIVSSLSFNCLRILNWVVSGWILYSVWVRGVNTIVDCRCDQWPRAARWGCQWPGLTHTVTSLHQESSIKSIARSSEAEVLQINVSHFLPDNFFCLRSCGFTETKHCWV